MSIIDKKGKISKTTFRSLRKAHGPNAKVIFKQGDTVIRETTIDNMIVDIFAYDIANDFNVELSLVCEDETILFTGKDYNWFLKGERLIDLANYVYDLESEPAPVPQKQADAVMMHVAVCSLDENDNPKIEEFEGSKADCIKWLNQQIVKNANVENEVNCLFCLDYVDFDTADWKTLKQLFEEGKIDLC